MKQVVLESNEIRQCGKALYPVSMNERTKTATGAGNITDNWVDQKESLNRNK